MRLIESQAPASRKHEAEQYRADLEACAAYLKDEGARNMVSATDEQRDAYLASLSPEAAASAERAIAAFDAAIVRMDCEKQASAAIRQIQQHLAAKTPEGAKTLRRSVESDHIYHGNLTRFAQAIAKDGLTLKTVTVTQANEFLRGLAAQGMSQKTVDQYRQAIQHAFIADKRLPEDGKLEIVKVNEIDKARPPKVERDLSFSAAQVAVIAMHQTPPFALATKIAYAAGLRAEGLLTLRRIEERAPDVRYYADGTAKELPTKFVGGGREGWARYTAIEKGGLCREVRLPPELARELEDKYRRAEPCTIRDKTRGTVYKDCYYNLPGGSRWSDSFSKAAHRALPHLDHHGGHGCRHGFVWNRRDDQVKAGVQYEVMKETISQELGHFRPDITTEYYLKK